MYFNFDFFLETVIKITAGIVCGFVLGIERKSHNHVIGMRTLILICVSSTLLSILSGFVTDGAKNGTGINGDPSRITAGVISGIGFLGGGAIMRQGMNIKGLTSAAIIWTAASLGLAIGAGLYIPTGVVLAAVVLLLLLLERVEERLFPAGRSKKLHIQFNNESLDMKAIKKVIEKHGFIVTDLNMSRDFFDRRTELFYSVKAPREEDFSSLVDDLSKLGNLDGFSITD